MLNEYDPTTIERTRALVHRRKRQARRGQFWNVTFLLVWLLTFVLSWSTPDQSPQGVYLQVIDTAIILPWWISIIFMFKADVRRWRIKRRNQR